MMRKISLLVAGVAIAVLMSIMVDVNSPQLQQDNQFITVSLIQEAKAQSYNHRKDCFLKEGCKFKIDRNCAGANCGSGKPPNE